MYIELFVSVGIFILGILLLIGINYVSLKWSSLSVGIFSVMTLTSRVCIIDYLFLFVFFYK